VSIAVTWIGSRLSSETPKPTKLEGTTLSMSGLLQRERESLGIYALLLVYFAVIVAVAYLGPQIFDALS
jgi:hypothetical protein